MSYITTLPSPVGQLLLESDGTALTGLWLYNQKYFASTLDLVAVEEPDLPVFHQTEEWMRVYFAGEPPPPVLPQLNPKGSPFRKAVWNELVKIPYGTSDTYGGIAEKLKLQGISAGAQAVGGAVGHNPILFLIPCHRVLSADGSLTGYAGGISVKEYLLNLEGIAYRKK